MRDAAIVAAAPKVRLRISKRWNQSRDRPQGKLDASCNGVRSGARRRPIPKSACVNELTAEPLKVVVDDQKLHLRSDNETATISVSDRTVARAQHGDEG